MTNTPNTLNSLDLEQSIESVRSLLLTALAKLKESEPTKRPCTLQGFILNGGLGEDSRQQLLHGQLVIQAKLQEIFCKKSL